MYREATRNVLIRESLWREDRQGRRAMPVIMGCAAKWKRQLELALAMPLTYILDMAWTVTGERRSIFLYGL